jgi:hypothetical protein
VAIDPDMPDATGGSADNDPTSLSIYALEKQDGLLKYNFQHSVEAGESDR